MPRTCPLCDTVADDAAAKCALCGFDFKEDQDESVDSALTEKPQGKDVLDMIDDLERGLGGIEGGGSEELLETAREAAKAPRLPPAKAAKPTPARAPGGSGEIDDILAELEADASLPDPTDIDDLLDDVAPEEAGDALSMDDLLAGGTGAAAAAGRPAIKQKPELAASAPVPAVKVAAPKISWAQADAPKPGPVAQPVKDPISVRTAEPGSSRTLAAQAGIPDSLAAEVEKMSELGRMSVALLRQLGLETTTAHAMQEKADRMAVSGDLESARNNYREVKQEAMNQVRAEITKVYRELSKWNETNTGIDLAPILRRVQELYRTGRYAESITFLNRAQERMTKSRPADEDASIAGLGHLLARLPSEMEYVRLARGALQEAETATRSGDRRAFQREIRRARDAAVTALYVLLQKELMKARELGEIARVKRVDLSRPLGLLKQTILHYRAGKHMQAAAMLERYRFMMSTEAAALAPGATERGKRKRHRMEVEATGSGADESWDWDEDTAATQGPRQTIRETRASSAPVATQAQRPPRQGPSVPPPETAPPPASVAVPELDEGTGYFIKEKKPVGIYHLLAKEMRAGRSALCICTSFPDRLKERFKIHDAKFIWLTMIRESGQGYDPERLDFEVTQEIYEFITTKKGYVVLFDALDLLISEQGADKTVEFVRYLNDHAAIDRGVLLVAAAASTDESVMGNLERFLEECKVPEDAGVLKRALGL